MWRFGGRIIGIVVGLTGGWYGVVVGFLVGLLFDRFVGRSRRFKGVRSFLFEGRRLRFKPERRELWIIAALSAKLTTVPGPPLKKQIAALERYLRDHFRLKGSGVEEVIDQAVMYPDALAEESLATMWRELGGERRLWPEEVVCWFYELAGERSEGVSLEELRWIRNTAASMGVPREQVEGIEAEAPLLEAEAASILGVSRSSDRQEARKVYRRLASQFHPDTTMELEQERRLSSQAAFVKIREAYERIINHLDALGR